MNIIRDLATVILTAVSVVSMLAILRYQVNRNEDEAHEDRARLTEKVDKLSADLATFLIEVKVLANGQAIINKFTTDALDSLNKRLDNLVSRVNSDRDKSC